MNFEIWIQKNPFFGRFIEATAIILNQIMGFWSFIKFWMSKIDVFFLLGWKIVKYHGFEQSKLAFHSKITVCLFWKSFSKIIIFYFSVIMHFETPFFGRIRACKNKNIKTYFLGVSNNASNYGSQLFYEPKQQGYDKLLFFCIFPNL